MLKTGQTVRMLDGREAVIDRIRAGNATLRVGKESIVRRVGGLVEVQKREPPKESGPTIIVKRQRMTLEMGSVPRLTNEEMIRFTEDGMYVPILEDGSGIVLGISEAIGKKYEAKMEKQENGNLRFEGQLFTIAGEVNRNRRIYPTEEMKRAVESMGKQCSRGEFGGACDHPWEMEREGRTCIRYHEANYIEADDKSGVGLCTLEINSRHPYGTGMCSNFEMGLACGLSTYGWGMARRPTDAERELYKLPDGTDVAIINGYELVAVDGVYRPSVTKAMMRP